MLPALLLAAMLMFGCKKPDTTAPEVTVILDQFNVIAGAEVTVSGNNLIVCGQKAASWRDAVTANCAVTLTFTPEKGSARAVQSGETITDAGILTITVTDEAGNTQTTSVKIDIINNAPEIALKTSEINIF